jgi:hypothetical protein
MSRHHSPAPSLSDLPPDVIREIARLTNARGHVSLAAASTSLRRNVSSMDPYELRRKATLEKMERRLSPTYDIGRRAIKHARRSMRYAAEKLYQGLETPDHGMSGH